MRSASSAPTLPGKRQSSRARAAPTMRGRSQGSGHVAGNADPEERRVEVHATSGVAEVAGSRPADPGPCAGAVDGGHGNLGQLVEHRGDLEVLGCERLVGRPRAVMAEVGAWAEAFAGARQHHHTGVVHRGQLREDFVELADHLIGNAVEALGPVEGQASNAVANRKRDGLEVIAAWISSLRVLPVLAARESS